MWSDYLLQFAAACQNKGIPLLPTWYKYLDTNQTSNGCSVSFSFPADLAAVALGVVDILLRIAVYVAIAFVIYGGVQYVTSQGEPDRAAKARQTILNSVIGLVIALVATGLVTFVGGQLL